MKRFSHIQRFRSLVLVALAVLWAVFMMIPSAAVIAEKGGKGKPNNTSGTTPTGETSSPTPTNDTTSSPTPTSDTTSSPTPTSDTTSSPTPTSDTTSSPTPTNDTIGGTT